MKIKFICSHENEIVSTDKLKNLKSKTVNLECYIRSLFRETFGCSGKNTGSPKNFSFIFDEISHFALKFYKISQILKFHEVFEKISPHQKLLKCLTNLLQCFVCERQTHLERYDIKYCPITTNHNSKKYEEFGFLGRTLACDLICSHFK